MWEDHLLPAFVKFTLVIVIRYNKAMFTPAKFLCDSFCDNLNIFHLLVQEIWTITVMFYMTTVFAEMLAYYLLCDK